MLVDLYYTPGSLPCRSVLLVAASLDLELNLKPVNLGNKEHLQSEFLKMNPQHCLPMIADDGYYLWESRAIICYLANCYGKDDKLYPKEPKARGIVDQRLYFDMGTLTKSFTDYYNPITIKGETPDPVKFENVTKAFDFLNAFLEGSEYVAGEHMTIADITMTASTSNFDALDFDLSKYPNVLRWFNKMKKKLPKYEEINEYGIKHMLERIELIRTTRASKTYDKNE